MTKPDETGFEGNIPEAEPDQEEWTPDMKPNFGDVQAKIPTMNQYGYDHEIEKRQDPSKLARQSQQNYLNQPTIVPKSKFNPKQEETAGPKLSPSRTRRPDVYFTATKQVDITGFGSSVAEAGPDQAEQKQEMNQNVDGVQGKSQSKIKYDFDTEINMRQDLNKLGKQPQPNYWYQPTSTLKMEFKHQEQDTVTPIQLTTSTRRPDTYFTATEQTDETKRVDNLPEAAPDQDQWTPDTNPYYDNEKDYTVNNQQDMEQGHHIDRQDSDVNSQEFSKKKVEFQKASEDRAMYMSEQSLWPQTHFLPSHTSTDLEDNIPSEENEEMQSKPEQNYSEGSTTKNFISSEEIEKRQDATNSVIGPQFHSLNLVGSQPVLTPIEQKQDPRASKHFTVKTKWQHPYFPAVPEIDEQEVETRLDRMDDFNLNGGLVELNETLLKAVGLKNSVVRKTLLVFHDKFINL